MNKLSRVRIVNKHTDFYRSIRLFFIGSRNRFSSSVLSQHEETKPKEANYIDILLDYIPPPWSDTQTISTKERLDTTSAFKKWLKQRNLSEQDGKMLNRLKHHIMNGGHPDFPRLTKIDTTSCLQHMTDDYFISIDKECFKWLKKQRKAYRNRTIHPWLQWKLEQLNITLEWTREPFQDRDFRWIGYHDDVLNNGDTAGLIAESDPLFPLHSKEQPLLKFLNPFYELWYETMPSTLKQLRLINANKEPKESFNDKDDIRATRIIKKWNTESKEWRYYIGPKDIDQTKIDEEILYNQKQQSDGDEKEDNSEKTESEEIQETQSNIEDIESINNNEEEKEEYTTTLRTAYLSTDLYDKNSYNQQEFDKWLKEAPLKPADEIPIEAMNYLRKKETLKELKESMDDAAPRPIYSKKQRGEYFVEALKRELIKPEHLDFKELCLIIQHLGLERHIKQNPNTKQMTRWVPYSAPMKRKPPKTKWNDWNGNEPVEIFQFKPQQYTDINGVFNELSIYYKTKHPGQPPWGVWDIEEPNFDINYYQIKVESYLKCWRETFEGKQFIENNLKRKFNEDNMEDVALYNKLNKGNELLVKEKLSKQEKINDNKLFRYKFGDDPLFETQCKEKTLEIQKLQSECSRIDEILNRVSLYNDI